MPKYVVVTRTSDGATLANDRFNVGFYWSPSDNKAGDDHLSRDEVALGYSAGWLDGVEHTNEELGQEYQPSTKPLL